MHTYSSTPKLDKYYMPAEYEMHSSTWMLWPERTDVWRLGAKPAQELFADIANIIVKYEPTTVGVSAKQYENARCKLHGDVTLVELTYDDAWIRDIGPTFIVNQNYDLRGIDWFFNAWGGVEFPFLDNGLYKWRLPGSYFPWQMDDMVARKILEFEHAARYRIGLVAEGGAFNVNGMGCLIAIEECLLNSNRNPGLSKKAVEDMLANSLDISSFIWLKKGLINEENNGHVDNMCCFIAPDAVILNDCDAQENPQQAISRAAIDEISLACEQQNRAISIHRILQPPDMYRSEMESNSVDLSEYTITRNKGDRLPASYVNSYILNGAVLIPAFSSAADTRPDEYDKEAFRIYSKLFPDRNIIQVPARELLLGGGGLHCIMQQVPYHK